ncbi:MAG: DUF2125 domain-containing protein [Rhodobacteraceae bacterium]|nr:DUF2125 domain-containing protein [Paracoccaceae bacterium]
MKNKIISISTALVIGCSTSVMAQDDVAGFLEGIQGMATQSGGTVSFSDRYVGTDNSVEYTDLTISAPDGEVVITADWFKAVPSASVLGQVTFTLSPMTTVTINNSDFPAPLVLNISNDTLVITVDGLTSGQDAPTLNYSVSANNLSISAETGGNPFLRALDLSFDDLAENFSITMATMLIENSGSISNATYTYDFTSPEDDVMSGSGDFADFEYAMSFFAVDKRRMPEYMSGALSAFLNMSIGESTGSAVISNRDMDMAYTGTSEGGTAAIAIQDGRFTLTEIGGAANYSFTKLNIDGMPIPPFDFSAGGVELDIAVPFNTDGDFEEAKVLFALHDLQVSESLLAMVDPGQVISRDPINFVIDVTANVKSNVDWNDPEASFESGNPADIGEIRDVSINQILIGAGGATITATGSADIDNSMGFPFPTGSITVVANGVQALVNGIVELGYLPQAEAGMAMGMMMAFARAGDNADEFISDIEFSPQGVTANGVPLPF